MAESRRKLAADTWGALLQVHAALVPVLDHRLRSRTGLPLGWYDVLLELHSARDCRLTMSQLGDRVVLSRTRVSRMVDELAEAGLVRREINPADARSAFAVLTDVGLGRFREAAPVYLAAIEEEFAQGLMNEDLHQMRETLGQVRTRVQQRLPRR